MSRSGICKCGAPARPGQGTCTSCHASYMREHRTQARQHKVKLDTHLQQLASLVTKHTGTGGR